MAEQARHRRVAQAAAPGRPWRARVRYTKAKQVLRRPTVMAALIAVFITGVVLAAPAQAAPYTLVINSTSWEGGDSINPGDGICANAAGYCTLRAAISEANALGGTYAGDVLITVDPAIEHHTFMPIPAGVGTPLTASPGTAVANGAMATWIREHLMMHDVGRGQVQWPEADGPATNQVQRAVGGGAMFHITAPMTIDLDDRLVPYWGHTRLGFHPISLFFVNAPNVNLYNIHQPISSSTSFVFGPQADNVLLDGGANGERSAAIPNNGSAERFAVFRENAQNVTVRGYDLSRFNSTVRGTRAQNPGTWMENQGIFVFGAGADNSPMQNIRIEDLSVIHPAGTAGACTETAYDGCRPRLLNFVGILAAGNVNSGNADWVQVNGLTFDNIELRHFNNPNSRMLSFTQSLGGTTGGPTAAPPGETGGALNALATGNGNAPRLRDLTVTNSIFADNVGPTGLERAVISLPSGGRLLGTTIIEYNFFSMPRIATAPNLDTPGSSFWRTGGAPGWTPGTAGTQAGQTAAVQRTTSANNNNTAAIFIPSAGGATPGNRALVTNSANSATASTVASGVFVRDNHFDGFNHRFGAVVAWRSGTTSVYRNTFSYGTAQRGTGTGQQLTRYEEISSWAVGGTAEAPGDATSAVAGRSRGGNLFRNVDNSANRNMTTWHMLAGTTQVHVGPHLPTNAIEANRDDRPIMTVAEDGSLVEEPTCAVTMTVRPSEDWGTGTGLLGTTAHRQSGEIKIDVYWTRNNQAEVFLGTATGITASGGQGDRETLLIHMPVGEVVLANYGIVNVPGRATTTQIVDPVTGQITGFLRLQTHGMAHGQPESTQFSRATTVAGICAPTLTINQAPLEEQPDPTMRRFLNFIVESSAPLDLSSFDPDSIDMTVEPITCTPNAVTGAPEPAYCTRNPALINARIVSFTVIDDSYDMKISIKVAVDDSATVTLNLGANTVRSIQGVYNPSPATYTDNQITFINPLQVQPHRIAIITADEIGRDYQLGIRPGAPVVTGDLLFTSTVEQNPADPTVLPLTLSPTIDAGEVWSDLIRVTVASGPVLPETPAWVHHTVRSSDPNFDGLVVPSMEIALFYTDPRLQITRRTFANVGDSSTPATIMATGTYVTSGSPMIYLQPVCFVWTVTNISEDQWETTLRDIDVTDTDLRLGTNGFIGHIPLLPDGESYHFSYCSVLIPSDTRVVIP
ncbi:MAG: hypothetical protein FWD83_01170 [Promicromonosporaceae bacterium]|nr:hypothetical protein [Promicromonosporaceae bacterium]